MTNTVQAFASERIVTPTGIRPGVLLVREGKIVSVVSEMDVPLDVTLTNYASNSILPGLVDTHVHINDPGRAAWEGFASGTKAAAAGGITTIVDMPLNSIPVTTTVEAFDAKIAAATSKLWIDCGFYAGIIPGSTGHLHSLARQGVLGAKAFLIDSGINEFPASTEKELREALPILRAYNLPLLVHAELSPQTQEAAPTDPRLYASYLNSRPSSWECEAIRLVAALGDEFDTNVHIVHLSACEAIPILTEARKNGVRVTVETCPHYLLFSAEEIADGDTRFKCAPPIRSNENREKLWAALESQAIDCIVSDHSPSPPELKRLETGDFVNAWGGISSVQFGLPAIWTEAMRRGFGLEDVARWMSSGPASLIGLQETKGKLAKGMDADLVVFNPDGKTLVSSRNILHRHKVTPYEGMEFHGEVIATYLRGHLVYGSGSPSLEARGRMIFHSNRL